MQNTMPCVLSEVRIYSSEKQEMGHFVQVWMFSDLLQKIPKLSQSVRSELQGRLVGAYRSLAREAWRQCKPFKTYRLAQSYLTRLRGLG